MLTVQSCPRVGQRKLWGIVHLARRYPRHLVNAACAQAMDQGVHSYRHVKALTEKLVANGAPRQPDPAIRTHSQLPRVRRPVRPRRRSAAMNMTEIERALRELRLSGIADTLGTA